MDVRAFILGILAAIAFIGAIVLAALERDTVTVAALIGSGSTFTGYIVGLYSSAFDEPQGIGEVDEPASVIRARDEFGRADALGIIALAAILAWVGVLFQICVWIFG